MPRMIGSGLSRREREIIEALHRLRKATVGEIQAALPDALSNSAVRTLLRIMEEKGYVQHHEDGRRYVYIACEPHFLAARSALQNVVRAFYGDDSAYAMYALLNKSDETLSDENFEEKIHQLTVRIRKIHREHASEEDRKKRSAAIQAAFESLRNQTGDEERKQK